MCSRRSKHPGLDFLDYLPRAAPPRGWAYSPHDRESFPSSRACIGPARSRPADAFRMKSPFNGRSAPQAKLFDSAPNLPEGMRYAGELISSDEERGLLAALPHLPFKEFEFHGFRGKRRTVSFGWHYDFNGGGLKQAGELPDFLLPLRRRAAGFANLDPQALEHVLLTEYRPGAGIGWHRDRPQFGDVIGISLLASCTFRLRRKTGAIWMRRSFTAEPRSAYLLRGASRTEWEHSIPPLETLRYSVTFRTLPKTPRRFAR
jgi:alkylated DNA repair dioxygenase AlkB